MNLPFLPKPKYESDPRWLRNNWAGAHRRSAQVWKVVQALRSMETENAKTVVDRLSIVTVNPGIDDTTQELAKELRFQLGVVVGKERKESIIDPMLLWTTPLRKILEASSEFEKAEREFAPLMKAAEQRDQADERVRLQKQHAQAREAQEVEAATKRALAKLEDDPELRLARAQRAEADAAAAEIAG